MEDVKQEIHAYQFIHNNLPKIIKNMKIDIIVMNPPYQLKDGGHGASARPIYHKFVDRAKEIARHVIAIIPARWYAGGKRLDDFRETMLSDKSIKKIVDLPKSEDVFPGVAIAGGICYFHRDSNYEGPCDFNGIKRDINKFDVLIRDQKAISILKKVIDNQSLRGGGAKRWFSETVSPRKPFGLPTNFTNFADGHKPFGLRTNFTDLQPTIKTETYTCFTKDGMKFVKKTEVTRGHDMIPKWKSICSRANGAASQTDTDGRQRTLSISQTLPPNSICLETYLVTGTHASEQEAKNAAAYLLLKLPRYLLSLRKIDQNISADRFQWVPILDWSQKWDDQKVHKHFALSKTEIETVERTIK